MGITKMKNLLYAISFLLTAAVCVNAQENKTTISDNYLGQKLPGTTPVIFAKGIVSTSHHEYACCFSPDGKEFYFTRRDQSTKKTSVMVSRLENGAWTNPEPLTVLSSESMSFEPFITLDNKRLYFQTSAVANGKLEMMTKYLERTEKGWSEIKDPGDIFNPTKTMHISATTDGTIYTTDISGGMGNESLGIIRMVNGKYGKLEKLSSPFNKADKQQHPWIAPDESYIVFTVRRPEQNPASLLFVSFRKKDHSWTEPVEIKLGMEAGQPNVSHDGKYLFFTSGDPRAGSDIYWVSAKIIDELRPKE